MDLLVAVRYLVGPNGNLGCKKQWWRSVYCEDKVQFRMDSFTARYIAAEEFQVLWNLFEEVQLKQDENRRLWDKTMRWKLYGKDAS